MVPEKKYTKAALRKMLVRSKKFVNWPVKRMLMDVLSSSVRISSAVCHGATVYFKDPTIKKFQFQDQDDETEGIIILNDINFPYNTSQRCTRCHSIMVGYFETPEIELVEDGVYMVTVGRVAVYVHAMDFNDARHIAYIMLNHGSCKDERFFLVEEEILGVLRLSRPTTINESVVALATHFDPVYVHEHENTINSFICFTPLSPYFVRKWRNVQPSGQYPEMKFVYQTIFNVPEVLNLIELWLGGSCALARIRQPHPPDISRISCPRTQPGDVVLPCVPPIVVNGENLWRKMINAVGSRPFTEADLIMDENWDPRYFATGLMARLVAEGIVEQIEVGNPRTFYRFSLEKRVIWALYSTPGVSNAFTVSQRAGERTAKCVNPTLYRLREHGVVDFKLKGGRKRPWWFLTDTQIFDFE
jgi:hypothetical protein